MDDGEIPVNHCSSLRMAEACESAPLSTEDNQAEHKIVLKPLEIEKRLVLPAQQSAQAANQCEAEFEISYYQANDRIKVEALIDNKTCAASHGEFLIRIKAVDEAGEMKTQSFPETWARSDESAVQVRREYPMNGAARLIWARINADSNTACACD